MKLPIVVLATCLAGVMATAGATAAPTSPRALSVNAVENSSIEQVQYKRKRGYNHRKFNRHRGYKHRHYRRGRGYRGWHRYRHRPYGWRDRGCIIVGPIWYCP